MKRAFVTVAPARALGHAALLADAARAGMPGTDCILYVLDTFPAAPDGCDARSAESLFDGDFRAWAFAHTEEELTLLVLWRALAALSDTYDTLLFASWNMAVNDDFAFWHAQPGPDEALYVLDSRQKTTVEKSASYLLQQAVTYDAPMGALGMGGAVRDFLHFCRSKADYLHKMGVTEGRIWDEKDIRSYQSSFYCAWCAYAPAFGARVEYLRVENLILTQDEELSPAADFRLLCWHEKSLREFARVADLGNESPQDFLARRLGERFPARALEARSALARRAAARMPGCAERYGWDFFADGTPVRKMLRGAYAEDYRLAEVCGEDPFADTAPFLRRNALTGDENPILHNVPMHMIYRARPDLQKVYPDVLDANRLGFLHWYLEHGEAEADLPPAYLAPAAESLDAYRRRLADAAAGRSFAKKVADKLARMAGRPAAAPPAAPVPALEQGVNLCGYIRGDFGVAEACRILAASLEAAGVPFTIVDFMPPEDMAHTFNNHTWDHKLTNEFRYNTNILLTNAPGTKSFVESVSPDAMKNRYNIGFWYWELPEFPENWQPYFDFVDEVWTASEFTARSFRTATDKPVHVVPCCVRVGEIAPLSRRDFGLPEDAFIFLMMYDAMSSEDRKNPCGVLRAFLSRFAGDDSVLLVVKVTAPEGWDMSDSDFFRLVNGHRNVVFLRGNYSRAKVNALLSCCDAFVSLHRSEGFGLGPAEAMYLGKPAVLTNWSGNTQYMTPDNCCPVPAEIVEIQKPFGEYLRGRHWAQPDEAAAAAMMERLVRDKAYRETIAANGRETILSHFSAEATGAQAYERLREIWASH